MLNRAAASPTDLLEVQQPPAIWVHVCRKFLDTWKARI